MVTIYDIAKKVGCASSTVSKALNNSKEVSEKRKKEIVSVAKEMGYVVNLSAKALTTKKSWLIGILFSENLNIGLEHHFFSTVIESFKKTMESYGYDLIFINKNVGNKPTTYLTHCNQRQVEGVLIVTSDNYDEELDELVNSGLPVVSTDANQRGVVTVVSNDIDGAVSATEHLINLNITNLLHISGPLDSVSSRKRIEGFNSAISKSLNIINHSEVVNTKLYSFDEGYRVMKETLSKEQKFPLGVFAASDDIALGAIKAIKEFDLKIPEQVSVVGFDDIEMADFTSPRLTTIKQDKDRLGEVAAEKLCDLIDGKKLDKDYLLPTKIIVRDSTN